MDCRFAVAAGHIGLVSGPLSFVIWVIIPEHGYLVEHFIGVAGHTAVSLIPEILAILLALVAFARIGLSDGRLKGIGRAVLGLSCGFLWPLLGFGFCCWVMWSAFG
jgi:hypothetical protein